MNGPGECSGAVSERYLHFNYDTLSNIYTFPNVCPEKNVYYCIERHAINAYDLFNDILFYIFARAISKVKVTVNEKPSATLDQEILNSIWKQAGWK